MDNVNCIKHRMNVTNLDVDCDILYQRIPNYRSVCLLIIISRLQVLFQRARISKTITVICLNCIPHYESTDTDIY